MTAPTLTRAGAEARHAGSDRPAQSVRGPRRRVHAGWAAAVTMLLFGLLIAPPVVGAGAYLHVRAAGQVHDTARTDALVVLGAAQFDGTPSPVLRARLDHARRLRQAGVAPKIITVGGKQPSDRFTEAQAGASWLTSRGVAFSDVIPVGVGTDTVSSLRAASRVARASGWHSVTLVSDPAHMARSEAIASRFGLRVHLNSTVEGDGSELTTNYLARETAGYLQFELVEQWALPRVGDNAE